MGIHMRKPRKSSAEVAQHLEDLRQSGLSLQAFCKREHLNPDRVWAWRANRSKKQKAPKPMAPMHMIPVAIVDKSNLDTGVIKLFFRSGNYFEFPKETTIAVMANLARALS